MGERVAVITGAAAGIGQETARRLAVDGHKIAVADIADADETIDLVRAAGSDAVAFRCDVSSPDSVAALGDAVANRFGRADVLIANAGIYPIRTFDETTWEQWRQMMSVNLDSLFLLLKAFLPGMRAGGWGRIVALASNTFHTGLPGLTPYVASKGGVIGVVRSLAGEIGEDGITINAVAPSLTRTKGTLEGPHQELGMFEHVASIQAIKRTQEPSDVAEAIAFLVSDGAGFITGQTLPVDGGSVRV
jgi:NAD(P)-dependent dehydrogenase (short-subunit alcohol dehydrogenase family)